MSKKTKKNTTTSQDFDSLFAELKVEYIDSFHEKIDVIYECWQKKTLGPLTMEYHKIKGTGTTYGVSPISQVAEIMEDLCHKDSEKLGLCVLLSVDLLKKICKNEKHKIPYALDKERIYKFLRQTQDELESA